LPKIKNIIPGFSNRLNSLIHEVSNGNQSEFAKKIHTSEAYLSQVINEHYGCSVAMIFGIAEEYPKININWLLTGRGEMYLKKLNQGD